MDRKSPQALSGISNPRIALDQIGPISSIKTPALLPGTVRYQGADIYWDVR